MTELIFTYRPHSWIRPISWINRITRKISKAPYDHVSILKDGIIYESTSGKGVHRQPYDQWKIGREGTWMDCYQVPEHQINMDYFEICEGKEYDYIDATMHFFKQFRMTRRWAKRILETKRYDKFTCSKLAALLMSMPQWWEALPSTLVYLCERRDYKLDKRIIE